MSPLRSKNVTAAVGNSVARVLIVDDEPDGAETLRMLLELRCYVVQVVTDSTLCAERLESFQPDVVLLDIEMPGVSGYELAKQIRTRPEFERVAIIALSGYADSKHQKWSLEAGCDHHLVKPVQLADLESAIAREVAKRLPQVLGS